MIENTVDPATGMATIRATMPNTDELLWPGTLVTAELTLRSEEAVVVPSAAVQVSQTGNFVFVIDRTTSPRCSTSRSSARSAAKPSSPTACKAAKPW